MPELLVRETNIISKYLLCKAIFHDVLGYVSASK